MGSRDLVVVGGSAGGVEALGELVSLLPEDFPAAVLVNLHLSSMSRSLLPQVLARDSSMPVVAAWHGMPLRPGTIGVGVPDRHLLVVDDHVELGHGPRENNHRPSHDAMFRSAAIARGPRATGVVLTGLLDDGAVGLSCLNRYGGCCMVQDPSEAPFPDMPRHALAAVPRATRLSVSELAKELVTVVSRPPDEPPHVSDERRWLDLAELESARGGNPRLPDGSIPGEPTAIACPDCHGVLHKIPDEVGPPRFRCRTGHAWTADSLLAQQDVALEQALWTAVRALDERADVSDRLAARSESGGRHLSHAAYASRGAESRAAAEALRRLLTRAIDDPEHGDT